jgi:hypothetical protein
MAQLVASVAGDRFNEVVQLAQIQGAWQSTPEWNVTPADFEAFHTAAKTLPAHYAPQPSKVEFGLAQQLHRGGVPAAKAMFRLEEAADAADFEKRRAGVTTNAIHRVISLIDQDSPWVLDEIMRRHVTAKLTQQQMAAIGFTGFANLDAAMQRVDIQEGEYVPPAIDGYPSEVLLGRRSPDRAELVEALNWAREEAGVAYRGAESQVAVASARFRNGLLTWCFETDGAMEALEGAIANHNASRSELGQVLSDTRELVDSARMSNQGLSVPIRDDASATDNAMIDNSKLRVPEPDGLRTIVPSVERVKAEIGLLHGIRSGITPDATMAGRAQTRRSIAMTALIRRSQPARESLLRWVTPDDPMTPARSAIPPNPDAVAPFITELVRHGGDGAGALAMQTAKRNGDVRDALRSRGLLGPAGDARPGVVAAPSQTTQDLLQAGRDIITGAGRGGSQPRPSLRDPGWVDNLGDAQGTLGEL